MSKTTCPLEYPIQVGGETVTELTLRRPTVRELRSMDKATGNVDRTANLIGALADLAPVDVDLIDASDFQALDQIVAGFLSRPPPTGGT